MPKKSANYKNRSRGKKISRKNIVAKGKKPAELQEDILLQPPRGMRDLLPGEQPYWNQLRRISQLRQLRPWPARKILLLAGCLRVSAKEK